MVAQFNDDHYEEVDLAPTGRLGDEVKGKALLGRKVVNFAERNLAQVIEFALIDIEGDEDAEVLRHEEISTIPTAAAWHARSLGYREGRADSAEEITRLQAEVSRLMRAEYSEKLFQIAIKQDDRINALSSRVDDIYNLLRQAVGQA